MKKPRKKPAICCVPGCKREANSSRGMCTSCYTSALSLINSSQTTWAKLEELGLCRPKHKSPGANPLRKAFLELTQASEPASVPLRGRAGGVGR